MAEVLNAACFLRNLVPCSSADWKQPFELFWQRPTPALTFLRNCGCVAYALNFGPGI
jgi:hypothetical protein